MNNALLVKYLLEIRASYWFIPSLMVVGAVILSVVTVWLDGHVSTDWPEQVPLLFSNKPDGARSLLATVAGSMITVAGVTFSLTLLALSHATSHFGPRLLNNFMRDRGNQITLGTFVSTFIYCLLVLRTVRSAEEAPHGQEQADNLMAAFVPHISVTIAMLMALSSVAVLIYFIHHIPESIRLSNVVSNVGRELCGSIDKLFPEMIAQPADECAGVRTDDSPERLIPAEFFDTATAIELDRSGFVQSIDEDRILKMACDLDVTIFIKHRPGDFYCNSTDLILVAPADRIEDSDHAQLRSLFALGTYRTISQNTMFAVDQLVEVAQRALSPGVNDPMTAMYCLDWLKAALVEVARREQPTVYRCDENGKLRVFSRQIGFEQFCAQIFDQLRPYVAADLNASRHMMKMIRFVQRIATRQSDKNILDSHADRLIGSCENSGMADFDIDELRELKSLPEIRVKENVTDAP